MHALRSRAIRTRCSASVDALPTMKLKNNINDWPKNGKTDGHSQFNLLRHPDKNESPSATEKFMEIQEAYDVGTQSVTHSLEFVFRFCPTPNRVNATTEPVH